MIVTLLILILLTLLLGRGVAFGLLCLGFTIILALAALALVAFLGYEAFEYVNSNQDAQALFGIIALTVVIMFGLNRRDKKRHLKS